MYHDYSSRVDKVDLSNFKIEEISATDKVILVRARKECPVYFCFYSHFIACSGDYGEWVFDCTWDTTKKPIPGNSNYLAEKLSRQCERFDFDSSAAVKKIENLIREAVDNMNVYLTEEQKSELEDTFYDFKSDVLCTDKYRYISIVDKYTDEIADCLGISFDGEDLAQYYDAGDVPKGWLIYNLAMLEYIRKSGVLDEYYKKNDAAV